MILGRAVKAISSLILMAFLAIEIQYHSIAYRKIEVESADGFCLLFSNSHVSMLLNSEILQVKCPEVK